MAGDQYLSGEGQASSLGGEIGDLLQKCNKKLTSIPISELLSDPDRFAAFSLNFHELLLDFSRVHLDSEALELLLRLADAAGVQSASRRLLDGEVVNVTEGLSATHTQCRNLASAEGLDEAERFLAFAAELHQGRMPGSSERIVTDIVHIGIGGSLLGPAMLVNALGSSGGGVPNVHFLGSVDAHDRLNLCEQLNPNTTCVIVASKSFTTQDSLLHARKMHEWLANAMPPEESKARLIAVTANPERAVEFGVAQHLVLKLPESLGGRFSAWSAVSLSAAASMGPDAFREFLAGANEMDQHFVEADHACNLPIVAALIGIWHRNVCGFSARAVVCYDSRLRGLPLWLQQLEMESGGKQTNVDGEPVGWATAPLVIAEVGTDAQHSVFQQFHQGTEIVPLEFVGTIRPGHDDDQAQESLLSQMLAQATTLALGFDSQSDGTPVESYSVLPGNRPSTIVLIDELTPRALGHLLAFHEHRVYTECVIRNIDAFDQWGVERGKQVADAIRPALAGRDEGGAGDEAPGLEGLLGHIRQRRQR